MKGQWFLISAVIAASAFLFISALFKSYFVTDAAVTARYNEDFYFHNIMQQIQNAKFPTCGERDRNLVEFRAIAQRQVGSLGYLLFMNYTPCRIENPQIFKSGVLVASGNIILCDNVNISDVFPNTILGLSCT